MHGNNDCPPPMGVISDQSVTAVAARIDALRAGLKLTQIGLANAAGIPPTAMNAYCQGNRRISLNDAIRLCQRFGVTLDWIYFGDESGLPVRIARLLGGHGQPPPPTS